jgi:hypothetical protein
MRLLVYAGIVDSRFREASATCGVMCGLVDHALDEAAEQRIPEDRES